MLDSAAADDLAIAVDKGDGEIFFLQPIVVERVVKGGDRHEQGENAAGNSDIGPFAEELDAETPPTGHMEPVHPGSQRLIKGPRSFARVIE